MNETSRTPRNKSNREMCFMQGKAYVYRPSDEPAVIRTEWPNGTVDEVRDGEGVQRRRWPDGTTETTAAGMPVEVPAWPRFQSNEAVRTQR